MDQHIETIKHTAGSSVGLSLFGISVAWPWIEEALRVSAGIVGLGVAMLQGYLAWQAIKEKRRARIDP